MVLHTSEIGIHPVASIDGKFLKILTQKEMFQNLVIAVAQVKVYNTSKSLPNKIFQIKYFLYQAKEITKKVYSNILNSI